ncbi:PREDICTED: putative ribonuclease H protein At1g65750-like [Fragaria vesca subsp. vesca]
MKAIAVDFFSKFFSENDYVDSRVVSLWTFPRIEQHNLFACSVPISMLEVKNALFGIGGLKAPGVDGFPAIFYQHHWKDYASKIFNVVNTAFSSCSVPPDLNQTIISLIPKFEGPQHMVNFRPISLCNTIYKVISKIIVARIRPFMQQLIIPNQVSYVPGRHISDNIMIAQELLFKFKKSCGSLGFFAWKVDLSKAYDRLRWSFIEQILFEAKFPSTLVKLIMSCITTTSFQICFNGELTSSFKAQRGIRQGDPLSPYIFVLCMEKLSHLINSVVDMGYWKPVRASQSGPKVSHLFFADDLMLFAEASPQQASIIKDCLDSFCDLSGLSGWSSKTLSMAGRLTLVQSVTASIPIYAMQTAKLPLSLCESIDKANINFLWGDSNEKKKIHLVNWESVCKPKHRGGLGLKKTADMNQAMLAKASWRIFQNDHGLWADIYRKKYLQDCCIESSNSIAPADCSNTWRGIVHGVELMRRNLKWRIGDGAKIKFWNATIKEFWCDTSWNISLLKSVLPDHVVMQIISVPSGFGVSGHDKLIWNATANGKFSVKSTYNSFFDSAGVSNPLWTHLWKLNCPPKLKTFMWSVLHQKILTNVQRVRRGFSTIASCPICKNADETLLHLLRDCPRSQAIWNSILRPGSITNSFSLDWNGWISAQFHCHVVIKNNIQWCNLFVFVCWFIWKWRNKVIFDPAFILPACPNKVIWNNVDEWFSAQSKASMESVQ